MSRHGTENSLVDLITDRAGSLWAGDTIKADDKADEHGLAPVCTAEYDRVFGAAVSQGNRKGRGPAVFDIYRAWSPDGKPENTRLCCMSVKTESEKSSYIRLTTGGDAHMQRVINAALNGYKIPVLVYQETGDDMGRVTVIEVSRLIQISGWPPGPLPFGERYGRGQAPAVYFSWSSVRKSGVKGNGKARERANLEYPYFEEETGIYHISPSERRYRELKVNLASINSGWIEGVYPEELPGIIEGLCWESLSIK